MPGVFISYRRDDTAGYAGRLYDALTAHFGKEHVFIDIDSIAAGQNFADVIEQQVASCSVVIVLIGKAWLTSTDEHRARRLDNPHDFVRLEVASALRRKLPVIPVLVGGAKMPRPDELPAPLAPLAYLNAIEIFDSLFRDSVNHLVNALQPFVQPRHVFWPWTGLFVGRLRIWVVAVILLLTLGIAGIILSMKRSPDGTKSHEASPPLPSEMLVGPESDSPAARVKVMAPADVAELPPIVEAARNVMLPGSSLRVTGPVKPHVLWRATVTVGDAWNVTGIAGDGTVYLYDDEHNVLDAIRDGKELWAYQAPNALGFGQLGFAPDGRVWLGDYCFNSRGEGGRVTKRSLLPDRTTLRIGTSRLQNTYGCRDGKVSAMDSSGKVIWAIDLDGNCSSQSPTTLPQAGDIYASSDARTVYAIARDGRLVWTVKQACRKDLQGIYPMPNDELIVACREEPLYALREGKPLWTSTISASEASSWSEPIFDGSGNVYVGAEGASPMTELTALDKSGKQIWRLSAMTRMPSPAGFDSQGRMYVVVSDKIVGLSQ